MKKVLLFLTILVTLSTGGMKNFFIYAQSKGTTEDIMYQIYDEEKNLLIESQNVTVGDIFINKLFEKYEIIFVDEENNFAIAKYVEQVQKPRITKKTFSQLGNLNYDKCICFYCSHNDESYEVGDNTYSIYGKGGIHDIATLLCKELQSLGVDTVFDETLHIPHDSYAYSRSKVTAKSLLNDYNPDAIFDIHRDGASRKTYVSTNGNEEHCAVRIVVGQANPYAETNLEFATYLMSISEIVCPWLFLDIYYATGHYNQNLNNKALLFEMGSHLVEKELVKKTVPYLAKVLYTALYDTHISNDEDLVIGDTTLENIDSTLNNYFDNEKGDNSENLSGQENNATDLPDLPEDLPGLSDESEIINDTNTSSKGNLIMAITVLVIFSISIGIIIYISKKNYDKYK